MAYDDIEGRIERCGERLAQVTVLEDEVLINFYRVELDHLFDVKNEMTKVAVR